MALVVASRKLRPYFHTHSIKVLTNYPLCQVLQKSKASGRLLKWVVELGQFDMNFRPQKAIKGQALADFIYVDTTKVAGTTDNAEAIKVTEAQKGKNSTLVKEDAG